MTKLVLPDARSVGVSRRGFLGGMAAASLLSVPLGSWAQDPGQAANGLTYHTTTPPNAEPALEQLIKQWLTPSELMYVRSHAPTPTIDANAYRLTIEGLVERPLQLTLAELNDLAQTEVVATLTCAGNRRTEHNRVKEVSGVTWGAAAIGNAKWSGVALSTLLKRAGLKSAARHVWFEGLDEIPQAERTIGFGGSIPIQKALLDTQSAPGALVATGMNGKPLPPDHGYPARTVVPGYIGARSVKWLGKIVVSHHASPNHYLQNAYKLVTSDSKLELAEAPPTYAYRVNSVIGSPAAGASLQPGPATVAGYALAGGEVGCALDRVELSTDGGTTWTRAAFDGPSQPYCWRLWRAEINIEPSTRLLIAKAVDSCGNRQPPRAEWNMKGYLYNAWHRVPVSVAQPR